MQHKSFGLADASLCESMRVYASDSMSACATDDSESEHFRAHGGVASPARAAVCALDACFGIALVACCWIALTRPAQAYVDPSVMTYTIQALAGVAVALSAVLGVVWRRARRWLYRVLKIDENAGKIVEPAVARARKQGAHFAESQAIATPPKAFLLY